MDLKWAKGDFLGLASRLLSQPEHGHYILIINFKEKWFLHDYTLPEKNVDVEYLKEFEEKYKIDLWNLAINERLFYRFNDFYKFSRLEILSILAILAILPILPILSIMAILAIKTI